MSFSFQFAFFVQPCGSIMARGMAGHVMTCNNIGEAMGMMLSGSSWARARQTVSPKPRVLGPQRILSNRIIPSPHYCIRINVNEQFKLTSSVSSS